MSQGLAVVTGASSGIGLELARCCARDGYALLICSDTAEIEEAAEALRAEGAKVETLQADLATPDGVARLIAAVGSRPVEALLANAGIGLGGAFLDQDLGRALRVVQLNIEGTVRLVHHVGRRMRARDRGRILITGSIAGFLPGSFQAVYNGTKAFLDNFSVGLRDELRDSRVTVTCLMPGATETDFFETAGMEDTKVGRADKADPADVARQGYAAMCEGESGVVTGFMNKVRTVFSGLLPDTVLAEMHRRMARPGEG
ncbi:SDR family NAD(P)-dependent oxidoreductase [Amaricoccus solimangrovi]|uniref:SDR family NAD(P)-dependent oxidoreductase n=1 Tax=Amaricoccus solimangrovi TaxID=2589815 RepID=A0A501WS57_9RHOB|nr:SDR family NAD(P)-dependent oxidoreductase [Amaricoccus solimangrovi]TPE51672.1 SDR family NAD(P)-dependent oxidoreductase [Amaricoccus solimangrovi]